MQNPNKRKVGFFIATSFVVGNLIGSGIFLLPSSMASFGGISLIGWVFSGIGALLFAMVFSRLSRIHPKAGGPYAYTRESFGDFPGFMVAWGYWISIWIGNAAIAVAFAGYLSVFIPELNNSIYLVATTALSAVWFLTWVNTMGTRNSGKLQFITSILKITPLLLIGVYGLFYIQPDHFSPFNLSEQSSISAVSATATLAFWALFGVESATIPAGDIKNPTQTIPKATMTGTLLVVFVYLLISFTVMGLIHPADLQNSPAPLADSASRLWGPAGFYLIGFGGLVATFGALNGWILMQAQIPMAIARDQLFPGIFKKTNQKGAPVPGLIISSILVSVVMLSNYTKGLVNLYTFLILVATVSVLVPYLFCALAEVIIRKKWQMLSPKTRIKTLMIGIPAFLYALWAIAGSGLDAVYYSFLLLMTGIPVFVWVKLKH